MAGRAFPDLSSLPPNADDSERMRALIDILSSYVEHFHGGEIEMVAFDGETLQVRLEGNCHGCHLSEVTLHGWIEGTVKPFFPKLRRVVSV